MATRRAKIPKDTGSSPGCGSKCQLPDEATIRELLEFAEEEEEVSVRLLKK